MNKCRECGARSTEHCTRWDCPGLRRQTAHRLLNAILWDLSQAPRRIGLADAPQSVARMNSPLDWDYADIKRRMQGLNAPPYTTGSGVAGHHCDHCPKGASEHCLMSCSQAYRDRYGREPFGAKIR